MVLRETGELTDNCSMAQPQQIQNNRIDKPVSTLAIVPKSGSITRIARQAYSVMMLYARDQGVEDADTGMFTLPLSQIIRGFDGSKGSTEEIKRHLKSMVSHVVEWQSPSPSEMEEWGACGLLSQVSLKKKNGELWLSWAYPPALRAEVLAPQRFAQLRRSTIAQFRTYAGLALYEVCCRYKDNPSHLTSRQHWTWWLPVLTGKPKATEIKTQFRFFNRDTLKPALDEVNEISELNVVMHEFKVGRSIEFSQFEVRQKAEPSRVRPRALELDKFARALSLGVDADIAEDLLMRYGERTFAIAVDRLEARIQSDSGDIKSRTAYLRTILSNLDKPDVLHTKLAPLQTPEIESPVPEHAGNRIQNEVHRVSVDRVRQARAELDALPADELRVLLAELRVKMSEGGMPQAAIKRLDDGNWQSCLVLGKLISLYWQKTRGGDLSGEVAPHSPEFS